MKKKYIYIYNLSHILKIYFLALSVALLFYSSLFISSCCFSPHHCFVLVLCGGVRAGKETQGNSSVIGVLSLVMAQIRLKLNCRVAHVSHCIKHVCIIKNFLYDLADLEVRFI